MAVNGGMIHEGLPAQVIPSRPMFIAYRGSVAHGMYTPPEEPNGIDDVDIIGVFMGPLNHYLGFGAQETIERKFNHWDAVHYEVRKFVSLLLKSNPNVLSALWVPEKYVLFKDEFWQALLDHRDQFSSKKAYDSFMGYAKAQHKKMTRFSHLTPEEREEMGKGYREEIAYREYMAREHGPGNYARPPYANWDLKTLRTKLNEVMGTQGYMGEKRRRLVETYGYDTKNAAHLIRLLRMGEELLITGELHVDRSVETGGLYQPDAELLLDIKHGKWSLDRVNDEATYLMRMMDEAYEASTLPEYPHRVLAEELVINLIARYYYGRD